MRSDLSANQRAMLAAIVRGQAVPLAGTGASNTIASLRRRGLVKSRREATQAGRQAMPLDDVVDELTQQIDDEGGMTTLSSIRVALSQAGNPLPKKALERAVLNVLLVLEDEGKVRGYSLERSQFDLPADAGDDVHAEPVGDAYWVAVLPEVERDHEGHPMTDAEYEATR